MKRGNANPAGDLYCTCCAKRGIPIYRKASKGRPSGHLKKMFCLNCQAEKNFVEVKLGTHYDYEDFMLEYNYHNFDENGNRKEEYSQFKNKLYKEGVIE